MCVSSRIEATACLTDNRDAYSLHSLDVKIQPILFLQKGSMVQQLSTLDECIFCSTLSFSPQRKI